ncbi:MAG: 16S rRNA processing protein RimM [Clostridia bacterium]|nr:16S rRNA processing protein RimM [Clostridia bacterium]MCR5695169.1 ribosome maturation factor RimM [Clostridia bacterium]
MLDYITIGKIVNVHGVHGEVKVLPDTDDVNRFRKLKSVLLLAGDVRRRVEVKGVKFTNKFVVLKLEGVDDRDQADRMRGIELQVERKDAIKLPEGRYFIGDLIGCLVLEDDGNELGRITDVFLGVGNDIYNVETPEGKTILIPVLPDVVLDVDVEAAVVKVKLPPGLREIYL